MCTGTIRYYDLQPGGQPASDAAYKFYGDYYLIGRQAALTFIDEGIRLGVLDEAYRRRFHAPTIDELWALVDESWEKYIKPNLLRDDGTPPPSV